MNTRDVRNRLFKIKEAVLKLIEEAYSVSRLALTDSRKIELATIGKDFKSAIHDLIVVGDSDYDIEESRFEATYKAISANAELVVDKAGGQALVDAITKEAVVDVPAKYVALAPSIATEARLLSIDPELGIVRSLFSKSVACGLLRPQFVERFAREFVDLSCFMDNKTFNQLYLDYNGVPDLRANTKGMIWLRVSKLLDSKRPRQMVVYHYDENRNRVYSIQDESDVENACLYYNNKRDKSKSILGGFTSLAKEQVGKSGVVLFIPACAPQRDRFYSLLEFIDHRNFKLTSK